MAVSRTEEELDILFGKLNMSKGSELVDLLRSCDMENHCKVIYDILSHSLNNVTRIKISLFGGNNDKSTYSYLERLCDGLNHCNNKVNWLCLNSLYLNSVHIEQISKVLTQENCKVKELFLTGIDVYSTTDHRDGLVSLFKALIHPMSKVETCMLPRLELYKPIVVVPPCNNIKTWGKLKRMMLPRYEINSHSQWFMKFLFKLNLTHLDINFNPFGIPCYTQYADTIKALCDGLKKPNCCLKYLSLDRLNFTPEVKSLLRKEVVCFHSLKTLCFGSSNSEEHTYLSMLWKTSRGLLALRSANEIKRIANGCAVSKLPQDLIRMLSSMLV